MKQAKKTGEGNALPPAHIEVLRPAVEEELRTADVRRLGQLMTLFEDRRLRLSRVLDTLFPESSRTTQQSLLRNFRNEINSAFKTAGLDVRFAVDSRKRTAAEERFCWFEGQSSAEPLLTQFTSAVVETTDPARSVSPRATLQPERQPVSYVVVHDDADATLAGQLVESLRTYMKPSGRFAFDGWAPCDYLAGQSRDEVRDARENASQVVIALLSPAFLANEELHSRVSRLRDGGRLLVPVALGTVDERRHRLGPFAGLETFRAVRRSFAGCRSTEKERFAEELWREIENVVSSRPLPPRPRQRAGKAKREDLFQSQEERLELPKYTVDPRARETPIVLSGAGDRETSERTAEGQKQDALEAVAFLQKWAADPAAPRFFALLGETGSGKTTTCKLLARRMLEAREKDPAAPVPIYLDLRRFSWDGTASFSLQAILEMVLAKSFEAGTDAVPSPADVIEQVQQQRALVLFDGLDEVIVHMTPKIAQDFIRELWRILPPLKKGAGAEMAMARSGKLLISCRSHYFRRVWEQNTMLLGEEREGLRAQDYRALVLLPFEPAQIEEYLRHNVPGLDVERALELIRSVHNLSEMAERPYTLSLIGEFLPELERKIAAGASIEGVDLYKAMVTRWLLRDEGKHHFSHSHKEMLMERLAAKLWASRRRKWSYEELEEWLDGILNGDERFSKAYGHKEREVLKEDLRTATFLVRPDAETFRFAHTSLQEYFLARHLQRALSEGAGERWSLPIPSDETIEFLLQLVRGAAADRAVCERTLETILGDYRADGSELALRFWLASRKGGVGFRTPPRLDLRGARLKEWHFSGTPGRPLDLRNADLRGADLRGAVFTRVNLSHADLSGANAWRAEFHEVDAAGLLLGVAEGAAADLSGTLWRLSKIAATDFREANLDRSRFIRCDFSGIAWPASEALPIFATCRDEGSDRSTLPDGNARVDMFTGHMLAVTACAVIPDGQRIVSASSDGTLRVWDGRSGESVLTLEGHRGVVTACAVSGDGERIVSGSDDGTLRVWDGRSGESVLTLEGHRGWVTTCAVSGDGERIVSGSADGTLRVWDARSGESVLTLEGDGGGVRACAVSGDGERIVSGSDDHTLRVWDARSGESVLTLEGHGGRVTTCAVSGDGERIVSGSSDGTLRVWDARSGESVLTLEGHRDWVTACAVSGDGERIVSGSSDGTLRVWDARSGESVLTLEGHRGGVLACAVSPDGERIVSGSSDGTLRVWDARSGESVLTLEGHRGRVTACAVSGDGERIVSGSFDGTFRVWDARSGESVLTLEGHRGWVIACAVSGDGERIVSGSDDGTLRVWDARSGESVLTLEGHRGWVTACAVSGDGERIVSGSYDGTLRVWDARSGESVLTLEGHRGGVRACAVSPDGERIVSGSDDATLRVWDARSGESVLTLEGHRGGVLACAVSADGERIVSGSDDGTLRVWDGRSGESVLTLEGHRDWVTACAVSGDGERIVSGSDDGTLRVWDGRSGESVLTLEGHRGWVRACAMSSDGARIVSGSYDGTLRVWDARSGVLLLTIARFNDGAEAVLDENPRRIRRATAGAWRWLGWLARDPVTGFVERYPAESFGALPGST